MRVEVLGCGSAFAPELGNSSFIVWAGEEGILFDCGGDVFSKLKNNNYLNKIKTVVISHLHGDHAGSLDTLIFWNYFILKNKLNIICGDRNFLENYLYTMDPILPDLFTSEPHPLVGLRSVPHYHKKMSMPHFSCAANIGVFFFSGDTSIAQKSDMPMMFHEVSFSPKYEGTVHTHYEDLAKVLSPEERAKCWLYHVNAGDFEKHNKKVVEDGFRGIVQPRTIIAV